MNQFKRNTIGNKTKCIFIGTFNIHNKTLYAQKIK